MSHHPQIHCAINLIKGIAGINEKESPFLFHLLVCLPHWVYGINTTVYVCLQSFAELINSVSNLRFSFGHTEYTFSNESSQYLSSGDETDSWIFAVKLLVQWCSQMHRGRNAPLFHGGGHIVGCAAHVLKRACHSASSTIPPTKYVPSVGVLHPLCDLCLW